MPTDIVILDGLAPDTLITLWSIQAPEAVAALQTNGVLKGNPEFAFNKPGYRGAYKWMQEQMQKRLYNYDGTSLPVWALCVRKDAPKGMRLLRIVIPKNRILLSFYQPWESILRVMKSLEIGNGWPLCEQLLVANECDEEFLRKQNFKVPEENEVLASWERIFDLTLANTHGFKWNVLPFVQAVIPQVDLSDVKEII